MIEIYKKIFTAEVNSGKHGKRAKLQKTVNLLSRYLYPPPQLGALWVLSSFKMTAFKHQCIQF